MNNLERARCFIEKHTWKFAKTYAKKAPHEYLTLDKMQTEEDKAEFFWFVNEIMKYGKPERFWRTVFRYLRVDGKKYWTMDKAVQDTDLINRAEA